MNKKLFLLISLVVIQRSFATEPNSFVAFINSFTSPYAVAITPNNNFAYVTDVGDSSVVVIDTNPASPTFNSAIPAPALIGVFSGPSSIAITPNNNFAYVADTGSGSVLVIDTNPASANFNTLLSTPSLVDAFESPFAIAIAPNGLYAYVVDTETANLDVIDINPSSPTYNQILNTPALNGILNNGPFDIVITPNGNYAYISNLSGSITVVDTNPASPTFNTPIAAPGLNTVTAQPEGLAISTSGLLGYVSDGAAADVTVIDTNPASSTFNTVLSSPNLNSAFNNPNDVASTGNYEYVTNFGGTSGSISAVSVIDANPLSPAFNTTLYTPGLAINTGITRYVTLAAAPRTSYVYAVDAFNSNLSVIYTGIPSQFSGCRIKNKFLLQLDTVNKLTWTGPAPADTPASYMIYRDAALTDLVATVSGNVLEYYEHNTSPYLDYTYYIVSVDSSGNVSPAASTQINGYCS